MKNVLVAASFVALSTGAFATEMTVEVIPSARCHNVCNPDNGSELDADGVCLGTAGAFEGTGNVDFALPTQTEVKVVHIVPTTESRIRFTGVNVSTKDAQGAVQTKHFALRSRNLLNCHELILTFSEKVKVDAFAFQAKGAATAVDLFATEK